MVDRAQGINKVCYGLIVTRYLCQSYFSLHCTAILECGMLIENDDDIIITFNSSTATLRCREGLSPTDVVIARCYDNGTWIPDPTDFHCTSSTSSGAMI